MSDVELSGDQESMGGVVAPASRVGQPTIAGLPDGYVYGVTRYSDVLLQGAFPDRLADLVRSLESFRPTLDELRAGGGGRTVFVGRFDQSLADQRAPDGTQVWGKRNITVYRGVGLDDTPEPLVRTRGHEIDMFGVGGRSSPFPGIAVEMEWNNKDPFFDRDLENFKRLHADGAISVGVIVTRGTSMQDELKPMVQRFAVERGLNSHEAVTGFGMSRTARQNREVERRVRAGMSYEEAWASQFVSDKYGQATTHWSKLEDRVHRGVGNPCPLVLVGLPSSIVTFDEGLELVDIEREDEAQEQEGIVAPTE